MMIVYVSLPYSPAHSFTVRSIYLFTSGIYFIRPHSYIIFLYYILHPLSCIEKPMDSIYIYSHEFLIFIKLYADFIRLLFRQIQIT